MFEWPYRCLTYYSSHIWPNWERRFTCGATLYVRLYEIGTGGELCGVLYLPGVHRFVYVSFVKSYLIVSCASNLIVYTTGLWSYLCTNSVHPKYSASHGPTIIKCKLCLGIYAWLYTRKNVSFNFKLNFMSFPICMHLYAGFLCRFRAGTPQCGPMWWAARTSTTIAFYMANKFEYRQVTCTFWQRWELLIS